MLVPTMIENLLSWLPRFLLPLWQMMLRRMPKRSRRGRLIFVEQPMSLWDYLDRDGAIRLHLLLHVTNESNTDAVIVSRAQVRVRRDSKFVALTPTVLVAAALTVVVSCRALS